MLNKALLLSSNKPESIRNFGQDSKLLSVLGNNPRLTVGKLRLQGWLKIVTVMTGILTDKKEKDCDITVLLYYNSIITRTFIALFVDDKFHEFS